MASMVAITSNNVAQALPGDKGSRNKRKFRADPPIGDPNKFVSLSDYDLPIYEFPSQITETIQTHENHKGCNMCSSHDHSDPLKLGLGLPTGVESSDVSSSLPKDENEVAYGSVDWADLTETELEELVLNNLEMIFKSAIKKLVACGYSEKVVNKVILRSGVYYGPRDMVSNIVDNTLSFIRNGHEIDPSKEYYFENLEQMEKYIFAELVCVLREARPSFSAGDALWCLLLCDMNINSACSLDGSSSTDVGPSGSTPQAQVTQPTQPEAKTETPSSGFCFSASSKPKPCSQTCECKAIPVSAVPNFIKAKKSSINQLSSTDCENKSVCTRKISGINKRENALRQKSVHLERAYRTYGSKGSSRSGKHLSNFGSLVLDKKLRSLSESAGVNFKSAAVKPTTTKTETKFDPPKTVSQPNIEKKTDTELSLSFPSQWTPYNKKDVMLMRLLPRERALKDQLRLWNEWANEKVMQVAKRLGKDKAELKALRQEREEAERVRREKQALEENTMKKLAELENAFCKAGGQMEWANGAIRRLEGENAWLRKEMEAARARAKEAAASCRERVKGEKEAASRIQSWEKEKGMFRDELAAEKRKREQLDREVELAEDRRDQEEARLKQEQKGKDELLKKADSIRKEREERGVLAKSQEEINRLNAETNLKKYKDGIQKLEQEISQLRLKNDSSKIAAMRRGVDPHIRDSRNKIANFERDFSGVKRDRECVMCLSEEMSVVFLPCAHQVVCGNCNDLHEKQGMKECPSCRSPIQKRVSVRYARH